MQATTRVLLLALAYLLVACGGGTTGSAPPTISPIARDTPIAAPTQPAQPTATAAATSPAIPPTAIPPTATTQAAADAEF